MKVTLSPQKKQELEQMHDSTRDSRVCDRIKAVLLASEGWNSAMISQALRIHENYGCTSHQRLSPVREVKA